jgi:hypothetical protein
VTPGSTRTHSSRWRAGTRRHKHHTRRQRTTWWQRMARKAPKSSKGEA